MTMIIGLAGPAKVGKSTTAKALISTLTKINPELKIDHSAFAEPLYGICSYLSGVPADTLMNQSYKETEWTEENSPIPGLIGWTPRKFLQKVGTECFRNVIHQDFWTQTALRTVSHLDIAIMADARFDNEFELCDLVIELSRDGIEYAMNHPSAMPPKPEFVDMKLHIFPELDFTSVTNIIYESFQKTCYNIQ